MRLRIGWMIRHAGVFGSVREAVELGNALVQRGHSFTLFTEDGKPCTWLPNNISFAPISTLGDTMLDALFWSDMPNVDAHYQAFKVCCATTKAFCVMGFNPDTDALETFGTARHHEIISKHWTIADGAWQLSFLSRYAPVVGPAIGGVNLQQFRPHDVPRKHDVIWSGDRRDRKGGSQVVKATIGLNTDSYSGHRLSQEDLAPFICSAPIFADGHKRGGHCNPVLEAMACGRAVVCTDTWCNSDFTKHGVNCLKVPVGDAKAMRSAIDSILNDDDLRALISAGALATAQEFSYHIRAAELEAAILDLIR